MRTGTLSIIIFLTSLSGIFAQSVRRLPPSLERELKLKHGGKVRIIGFVDTLKAQNLIAQSLRDTAGGEELDSLNTKDTAIIMIDSSVSLTDKEWLDSMMAQLPEYEKTPEGIRFHYPADVLVETNRKVVPKDTTLISGMDPVTKEDLPLYGNLPMPKPFGKSVFPRTTLELEGGTPYLPRIEVHSLAASNDVTAIGIDGKFYTTGASTAAVKQYWKAGASGAFVFPNPALSSIERIPELDLNFSTGANTRLFISDMDSASHTLSQTDFDARFTIGSPKQLFLHSGLSLSRIADDGGRNPAEDEGRITLALSKDIFSSHRINFENRFDVSGHLGMNSISTAPWLFQTTLSIEEFENPIQWKTGIVFLTGSDAGGNTSFVSPILSLRGHPTGSLEIGASFQSENRLAGLKELLGTNLFYSPGLYRLSDDPTAADERRIVTEPVHITFFANYLFDRNEIHSEFRFIRRNNDPVFEQFMSNDLHRLFHANPTSTFYWELESGTTLQLFELDKLSASLLVRDAEYQHPSTPDDKLPFVPTIQLQAYYQFGIWEKFVPRMGIVNLQRPGNSFTFINFDARYILSSQFQLKCAAENILNSAGDFWTGYNEYPQMFWVGAQYAF